MVKQMVAEPDKLIGEFSQSVALSGQLCPAIAHELNPAPHVPSQLPLGKCAIYVFSLCSVYGANCRAGAHRTLKVGKMGPNSNARFQSQHYNPGSAQRTLAGSLLRAATLWPYLGITTLSAASVGDWIRQNTDRDHFFIDSSSPIWRITVAELERYLKGLLNPMFEGS